MPDLLRHSDPDLPYRQAAEQAPDGVLIVQDGHIVFCNPRLEAIIGHKLEALAAHPFTDFIHPEDRALVIDHHVRRLRGEQLEPSYQFRVLHALGHCLLIELTAVIMSWGGRPATWSSLKPIEPASASS